MNLSTSILKKKNKGSVILVTIVIFVILLGILAAFLKSTTQRQYTTKKLNKVLLAREFSNSIALLATHKLKDVDLKDKSSKFATELGKPLKEMSTNAKGDISESQLTGLYGSLIGDLKKANSELGKLSFKASWNSSRDDFEPLLEAYPREKVGKIKIFIAVEYTPPASNEKITENYLYHVDVKITANIVPVLSKFTLYLEDAISGDASTSVPEDRFNILRVNSQGRLINGNEYRPWVLRNGPETTETTYKDFVEKDFGLVYLGSPSTGGQQKPINLGLSRSWNEPGECSEGLHLLAGGRGDGLYTVEKLDGLYQLNWEIGLADDNDGDAAFWFELIYRGFYETSKVSSILKLYGTDPDGKSPTLVLGNVKARTLCARAYKGLDGGSMEHGPLHYMDSRELFEDSALISETSAGELHYIRPFVNSYRRQYGHELTYETYVKKYGSVLWDIPYNRSLMYMATSYLDRHPENSGAIPTSDSLFKFTTGSELDDSLTAKVPEPFDKIYNVKSLKDMNKFLDKDKTFLEKKRIKHIIDLTMDKTDLVSELKKRHLIDERELNYNLNCWIYVKSNGPITIAEKSINVTSHGGIILEQGDIIIKGPIISTNGDHILHLVALDGNIDVEASGDLNVALIAASKSSGDKGQVKIIGKATSSPVQIRGNVVAKHIKSIKNHMARGLKIEYNPILAALPYNMNTTNCEDKLLMYAIDEDAKLVE